MKCKDSSYKERESLTRNIENNSGNVKMHNAYAKNNGKGGADDEDSDDSGTCWISWFCDLEGHEFFVEVRQQW